MKSFKLAQGIGDGETTGCVMAITAAIAGEKHTDHPTCACPILTEALIIANDAMDQETRDRLLGDMPWRLIGTRGTKEIEQQRMYILADVAVRKIAPIALDEIGRKDDAALLRSMPKVCDQDTAKKVHTACARGAHAAYAAYAAHAASAVYAAAHSAHAAEDAADAKVWEIFVAAIDECIDLYREDHEYTRDRRCEGLLEAAKC